MVNQAFISDFYFQLDTILLTQQPYTLSREFFIFFLILAQEKIQFTKIK